MGESSRASARRGRLGAVAVACAFMLGSGVVSCVGLEKRQVDDAREALDACEEEHGVESPECKEIRLRLRDAQERYEERARRAWACDPTQDECPTQR